ncbi:MAG: DUF2784 domain-containing protein [Deltaproteobacteria bacterium]|nr:DUF2784 domain-containing protein [Deltaproteobacteria bacterium]
MRFTMLTIYLADIVAIIHLGYVVFVILGFICIVAGIVFRWRWIRNPWFRVLHLAAIIAVAMEAIVGVNCPLTVLEFRLRYPTGPFQESSFIGGLIDSMLFYDAPGWLFTAVYCCFGAAVLITFIVAPPKRKGTSFKRNW